MPGPIWLVGMMGAGKSTVAPLVASRLGRQSVDTDRMIADETGAPIGELLADGRFRRLEQDLIASLAGDDLVVAAGGGAVTTGAADVMKQSGFVVWLRAEVGTLAERVTDGAGRPLLGADPRRDLERLIAERSARYEECADAVVDTDGLDAEDVADLVVETWKSAS